MAKKKPAPKPVAKAVKAARGASAAKSKPSPRYHVVLRTREMHITAAVEDRTLYPKAVAWNRLLTADQGRRTDQEAERRAWHQTGHKAILDLAESGGVTAADANKFIDSAVKCGEVQVEMEWERENIGWAARLFPWEALLALATKQQREQFDSANKEMVVVRMLRPKTLRAPVEKGPSCFAVSAGARQAGFDTATERAAIEANLGKGQLIDLPAENLEQLEKAVRAMAPKLLHYVLSSVEEVDSEGQGTSHKIPAAHPITRGPKPNAGGGRTAKGSGLEDVARAVSSHGPELVTFSTCHSGRRLAPIAIAHGARHAVGFHGQVMDGSIPVFFGAFYREWNESGDLMQALRAGLAANRCQKRPDDLGVVTIWSAVDLLESREKREAAPMPGSKTGTGDGGEMSEEQIVKSLIVTCEVEKTLNYSMLHNKRGGLVARFDVLKVVARKMGDLEVIVKIDTGLERPVECHFFSPLPEEANRKVEFVENVFVPLGSELMRRRGEMLRGTVEISIRCGDVQVFHRFGSIELPPCDEWKDDEFGRRYLPSFIFPRDPAVRDIITASQPFLRALKDESNAYFAGYQVSDREDVKDVVRFQLRALWAGIQNTLRIDYTNPPPSYTRGIQRVRTPEEVLRSRRGTCIELALLLAACWEHIGILPVVFLTPGHAFVGFWTNEEAWARFFDPKAFITFAKDLDTTKEGLSDDANEAAKSFDPAKASGGGTTKKDEAWVLKAPHHLAMIHREVKAGNLVPVEATYVAMQGSFKAAEETGRETLAEIFRPHEFDGMLDVQTARNFGVTPLAIITQGTVA
jgi:hypothetical protein